MTVTELKSAADGGWLPDPGKFLPKQTHTLFKEEGREGERERERQTEMERDRQTDRERKTDRQE